MFLATPAQAFVTFEAHFNPSVMSRSCQASSDAFSPHASTHLSLLVQSNMDQLDLPPLPASQLALNRKRTRLDYEPATSSDPAVFSSDEQAPSAESYSSKRRKDKWTGTWWGAKVRDATMKRKRSFQRNFDSGIYMGSEGTDSSLEDEFLQDMERKDKDIAAQNQRGFQHLPDYNEITLEKLPRPMLLSPLHHQVRGIVQQCLEQGKEDVDLS
jgi:hypothetical protein